MAVGTIASATRLIGTNASAKVLQASPVSASGTGNYFDVTTASLSAGVWALSGVIGLGFGAAATVTNARGGIGTGAGASSLGLSYGDTEFSAAPPLSGYDTTLTVSDVILSLAVTTSVYLKARFVYTGSAPVAYGRMTAIQIG